MLTAATKAPLRPAPQSPENISTSGLLGEKCREVEEKRRESQCWQRTIPDVQQHVEGEFHDWLERVFDSCNLDRRARGATVAGVYVEHWNQKQCSMNNVLALAKEYLVQWKDAQQRL
ncbi:hypothetical protein AgCh_023520 [Apium graveolens]